MKINKITVILAILLMSIIAIGAVSAESIDDTTVAATDDDAISVADSSSSIDSNVDDASADSSADLNDDDTTGDTTTKIVNDTTYSTYFDSTGAFTDEVSEGDELVIDAITNKNITVSKAVTITGNGVGTIKNGTISLVGESASNSIISGIIFNNFNLEAIVVSDASNITITDNVINIEAEYIERHYDMSINALIPTQDDITAIETNLAVSDITISNNNITISGNRSQVSGISIISYIITGDARSPVTTYADLNPEVAIINNFINITNIKSNGVVAPKIKAIYLDTVSNSVIEENTAIIVAPAGGYYNNIGYAYGIQLDDHSLGESISVGDGVAVTYSYDDAVAQGLQASTNVTIRANNLDLTAVTMVYGITTRVIGPEWTDGENNYYYAKSSDIIIADNTINAVSDNGVLAIVIDAITDSFVTNNLINLEGTYNESQLTAESNFGTTSEAIAVVQDKSTSKLASGVTISDNIINTNFGTIDTLVTDDESTFSDITIDDNIVNVYIDDSNFDLYFEDGVLVIPESGDLTLILGNLTDKNMTINQKVTIKSNEDSTINGGTITLTADASDSTIDGLTIVNDYPAGYYPGLAVISIEAGCENIAIINNNITWVTTDSNSYTTAMGIQISGGNEGVTSGVYIENNVINISGDAPYMYGIDAFSTPWNYEGIAITNMTAFNNTIILSGASMVEPFYLSHVGDSVFVQNTISSESTGTTSGADVYGFGVSGCGDISIIDNTISATGNMAGFGISIDDTEIATVEDNTIIVNSTSAVGIGVAGDSIFAMGVNDISIVAGDYSNISTWDPVGLGADEIKIVGNTSELYIIINDDTYSSYFNSDGTLISPLIDGANLLVENLTNKNMIIDQATNIFGSEGCAITDGVITIKNTASGSGIYGVTFVEDLAAGSYPGLAVISIEAGCENITIAYNDITWESANSGAYTTAMGIQIAGGSDGITSGIDIYYNTITMSGDAPYMYGIDAFSSPWNFNGTAITDLNIVDNVISVTGTNMVEPIYLSSVGDSEVSENTITSVSTGNVSGADAYGIGASGINNVSFNENTINVSSNVASFGLSLPNSENLTVESNDITVVGESAIGVGLAGSTASAEISNNRINITAGDFSEISTYDTVGTGASPIKVSDGATAVIDSNVLISSDDILDISSAGEDTEVGVNYMAIVGAPIVKKNTTFVFSNMTTTAIYTARTGEYFVAKLTDSDGNALANKTVQIGFNGATYTRTTDENGSFRLQVNLKIAGGYTFAICFLGDEEYNGTFGVAKITVKKATTKLTNVKSKYTYKSSAKTKSIAATLKLKNGTVISGKTVKFTVNGKTYSATTNSKGVATVKVSISAKKTYTYTVKFATTSQLAAANTTGKLVIN